MITKEQAMSLQLGATLRHKTLRNREGKLMEATVIARCHTSNDMPEYWSVSVRTPKISRTFEVDNYKASNWEILNAQP